MNGWMEVGRVGGGGSLCGCFCDMLRLTELVPERLDGSAGSKCAWVKNGFAYDQGLLYRSLLFSRILLDLLVANCENSPAISSSNAERSLARISLGIRCSKSATAWVTPDNTPLHPKINDEYCGIPSLKTQFLVRLCEICHRKASSQV